MRSSSVCCGLLQGSTSQRAPSQPVVTQNYFGYSDFSAFSTNAVKLGPGGKNTNILATREIEGREGEERRMRNKRAPSLTFFRCAVYINLSLFQFDSVFNVQNHAIHLHKLPRLHFTFYIQDNFMKRTGIHCLDAIF